MKDKKIPILTDKALFKQKCQYLVDVCVGLSHLHKLGVVHMDLKPENIMLPEDGLGPARVSAGPYGALVIWVVQSPGQLPRQARVGCLTIRLVQAVSGQAHAPLSEELTAL